MLGFLKNEKENDDLDYEKILKENNMEHLLDEPFFNEYLDLMMKGYENPGDITYICAVVIVALAHFFEVPKPVFNSVLEDMEKLYDNAPSKELLNSMMEYKLV